MTKQKDFAESELIEAYRTVYAFEGECECRRRLASMVKPGDGGEWLSPEDAVELTKRNKKTIKKAADDKLVVRKYESARKPLYLKASLEKWALTLE